MKLESEATIARRVALLDEIESSILWLQKVLKRADITRKARYHYEDRLQDRKAAFNRCKLNWAL